MMKTKKMIQNSVLGLTLFMGLQSIAAAEYRCGWLDNPAPDQYQFIDKQATWTIMKRGGYQLPAASVKNLPQQNPNEFVRTNGSYGYSCSCMSVTTDARSKRITSIQFKGKQVLLKRCLEDKAIAGRQHAGLRFPGAPVARTVAVRQTVNRPAPPRPNVVRPNNRNLASALTRPSGSYTDTPVIAGRPNAQPNAGYYDQPQVGNRARTARTTPRRSTAAGKSKSHYIQVIVTSIPAKAKRLKNSFDKAGFKTVVNGIKRKGKVLHKVRVGPYSSRRAALSGQKKLRNSFKKDQGVQKSIIVG